MMRAGINDTIWALSLLLQVGLLVLLFVRGLQWRMPVFTLLLIFYPLRAVVLFAVASRIAVDDYGQLYDGFALAGLALMMAVAVELGIRLWSVLGNLRAVIITVPLVAWLIVLSLLKMMPHGGPLPVDRVQMISSVVMVLLMMWAVIGAAPPMLRAVAVGLGAFGLVDVVATAGKVIAASHHDVPRFAAWSYADSLMYLLIVVFWMFVLTNDGVKRSRSSLRP